MALSQINFLIAASLLAVPALAQDPSGATIPFGDSDGGFPGLGAGRAPVVEIPWNRLVDADQLYTDLDRLCAKWPTMMSYEVIGHSVEGREMRVYTLNNPATGPADTKPAMWIDGNIHGNEVQGGEAVVYTAWYLLENAGHNARVDSLLERSSFYLLPSVNIDGRASWFDEAHNPHSSRTGVKPTDNDRDGLFDEDGPDDLDGDGQIVQMRKHVPGEGTHNLDPEDPRILIPVPTNDTGAKGDWIMLGSEGIDNDGDGRTNEDGKGGYDMNRSWPAMWMPEHIQRGAGPFPLYWPETRCIAKFLVEHTNIASFQSFHNNGGMILRGPGAESYGTYPRADIRVYDEIGKDGEGLLPFYNYMIIWKDLYSVYGGEVNFAYETLGIISFTNELWTSDRMSPDARYGQSQKDRLWADDHLTMGAGFVDWHPFEHPVYGEVEIGGFRKDVGRVPPSYLIEEMLHRNALFCIRHAEAMPEVQIRSAEVTDLPGGLYALDVTFENLREIPTRTALASQKGIGIPDRLVLTTERGSTKVVAAGFLTDKYRPNRMDLVENNPSSIPLESGLTSRGELTLRWILSGRGTVEVSWSGEKAKNVSQTVEVK
ncbi:MAG: hypothetical protein ACJAZ8_001829 [Planctomycetota bacterium]|jgi:hypothetical protein